MILHHPDNQHSLLVRANTQTLFSINQFLLQLEQRGLFVLFPSTLRAPPLLHLSQSDSAIFQCVSAPASSPHTHACIYLFIP